MSAYVIAHLREAVPHTDIAEYIERIAATFEPYGGRTLVHSPRPEVKEGDWAGQIVMIGFPGTAEARAWWESPAYREIVPLRQRHSRADVILLEGVPEGYEPAVAAQGMRDALAGRQQPSPADSPE
ncbi:DUF1330 domain-containing protein [Streptomyces sp. NPDC088725]|uniref:DUF1330 domain-containing protein n=1 Tax=Streptomyces sp. NPDC088725 TaxID=3365873 RepID=UPI003828AACC